MNERTWKPRPELPTFEPPGTDGPAPKQINTTRRVHNVLYVAGNGPRTAKIMFVMPALTEDDARENVGTTNAQFQIALPARYMKSQAGGLFKNVLEEVGLPVSEQYFTAICKWLLPKARRSKPNAADLEWAREALEAEIKDIKPEIIVCLGKSAFDFFLPLKLKLKEIEGGWFHSKEYDCRVYPMEDIQKPLLKPEYVERMRVDLLEVRKMRDLINGFAPPKIPTNYEVIHNALELQQLVARLSYEKRTLLSVDCEWGGNHHVDGKLRSFQICWAPGCAAYVRFMDENVQYVFDISYKEAGAILGTWLNQPQVKYIGQQLVADMAWMSHTLGLTIYKKAAWDTLYAQQCIDENTDAKLERMALAYTDLGRYDIELVVWKKENKVQEDEGYGRIPDSLIIPYACRDVDSVMRIYPIQLKRMIEQGPQLLLYYTDLFLPFVTDIFANFTLVGLPMDMQRLDALRAVFLLARDKLNRIFQQKIEKESRQFLIRELGGIDPIKSIAAFQDIDAAFKAGDFDKATEAFTAFVPELRRPQLQPFFEHYLCAPAFNIRSVDQMRRWLFEVKKFTPLKSTNNKEKGLPSMAWEKVLRLSEHARKDISPSTDKQTLKVLSEKDSLVNELLELNAVGNLTKAFLRPAEVDDEGNLVKENGLHFWVASDLRVHPQYATTETGRPRTWKPNCLNWPSWINNQIANAIHRVVLEEPVGSEFHTAYVKLMGDDMKSAPPSIRSCSNAQAIPTEPDEDGWCLVESDYQTAEVRGLAYISGDKNLIRLMNEDDTQFVCPIDGDLEKDRVRIRYAPDYGVAPEHQNPDFLWALVKDGKVVRKITEAEALRRPDGSLWHPKHDLHWCLAEMCLHKPREVLHKKKHRDGLGKTGNFKSAYGSSSDAMERAIEAETGTKPETGTGDIILKALATRQPVADSFLRSLELIPDNERILKSVSGRIRHFASHDRMANVAKRTRDKVLSGLAREARNVLFQTSVADTAARAGIWLTDFVVTHGMKARVCAILYDSVVTLTPLRERFAVAELHQLFMTDVNNWVFHGTSMNYPIDTELNYRWSCRPSKAESKQLDNPEWCHDVELTKFVKARAAEIRAQAAQQGSRVLVPRYV
jgi:uracil-DNA glycosylase family 4